MAWVCPSPASGAELGPVGGTLLLGLVWAGWHLPQFLMPEWADQNGGLSATTLIVFVGTVLAVAVILTWLFNHTGGSILLAILAHSSVDTSQAVLNPLFPAVNTDLNGLIGFGVLALAILGCNPGQARLPGIVDPAAADGCPRAPRRLSLEAEDRGIGIRSRRDPGASGLDRKAANSQNVALMSSAASDGPTAITSDGSPARAAPSRRSVALRVLVLRRHPGVRRSSGSCRGSSTTEPSAPRSRR